MVGNGLFRSLTVTTIKANYNAPRPLDGVCVVSIQCVQDEPAICLGEDGFQAMGIQSPHNSVIWMKLIFQWGETSVLSARQVWFYLLIRET